MAFANSDSDERKRIFARHLLNYVPLAAHIRRVLDERASHVARKSRFIDELEDFMSEDDAEQTLRAMISLGPLCRGVRVRRRERRVQSRESVLRLSRAALWASEARAAPDAQSAAAVRVWSPLAESAVLAASLVLQPPQYPPGLARPCAPAADATDPC